MLYRPSPPQHSPSITTALRKAVTEGLSLHGPSAVGLVLHGVAATVVIWLWAGLPLVAFLLGVPWPVASALAASCPLASAVRHHVTKRSQALIQDLTPDLGAPPRRQSG